ncbi:MAG TPA: YitT family protein [Candidatus Ozemobacteraceae bacterium]|nr:YitT family protein [Candidatus Ozemobacteraceae bacterium]
MARTTNVRTSDVLLILFSSFLLSVGLVCFTAPNKIASGGLTGLATVLYFAIGTPIGTVVLIGNLILLGIQAKLVGTGSVWKTILSVVVSSVLTDLMMGPLAIAPLAKDPLLACLYGGILGGIGVGLTFRAGGTTGGIDIVALILHHRWHIPIGDTILAANFLITLIAGAVFGPDLALYGLITVFFSGRVIDTVLEGMSVYRSVLIISKQSDEISWAIIEELHRGVTRLDGLGMYTSRPTHILLVAVRRQEMPTLRCLIHEFDPNAFVIVGETRQILGKGFIDLGEQVRRESAA